MHAARLIRVGLPVRPRGVALLLHGGWSQQKNVPVSPVQPSVLRMIPLGGRVLAAGRGRLAVFRLLNTYRGWHDEPTPLADLHWALERMPAGLPICLVGHSLGGRTALLGAADPRVRSAVALAPWVYPDDQPNYPGPRQILMLHGEDDRIAKPSSSRAVAVALRAQTTVSYVTVEHDGHALMRREPAVDRLAARFAAASLLGARPGSPVGDLLAGSVDEQI